MWVGRVTSCGTLLASLPPTVLCVCVCVCVCVCQDPAAAPAHPRLGGHCWDTPGLLQPPQGLGGAGGVKEEPLIWGLPTLARMRADLSFGLGSVLHWFCHAGGGVGCRYGGAGVSQSRLWLKCSTSLGEAWPGTRLCLWTLSDYRF